MGLTTAGTIFAWGNGGEGMLGQNNTINYSSPRQIGTLTNWSKISIGALHWGAVKTDGTLWFCGNNPGGASGTAVTTHYSSPVQVGALTTWNSPGQKGWANNVRSAGKTDGTLWTWGYGTDGYLGHGNVISRSSPVQLGTDTDWQTGEFATSAGGWGKRGD